MRLPRAVFCLIHLAFFVVHAYASTSCSEALVKATYSRLSSDYYSWSLATLVTEKQYDDIKHDASASATIYGIPMGASYSDFKKSALEKMSSYSESLTSSQATNVQWTGLDPKATSAYSDCLKSLYSQGGLHLEVKAATKNEVSVEVAWSPVGSAARTASLQWVWHGKDRSKLPKTILPGTRVIVLKRPDDQRILGVNYDGRADSLTIEPIPVIPPVVTVTQPPHFVVPLNGHLLKSVAYWSERHASQEFGCIESTPRLFTRIDIQIDRVERGRNRSCSVPPPFCDSVGETCDEYVLSRGCFVSTEWLLWYRKTAEQSGIPFSNESACNTDLALR